MTEITVHDLYERLARKDDLFLLDVRAPNEFERWRIEAAHTPPTVNIPYVAYIEDEEETVARTPVHNEMVVVCAKGGASDYVAEILRARGMRAINLRGGMIAWGSHYVSRPVSEKPSFRLYQIDRVARGCLSYLLLCDGDAAVIDPGRHTDRYAASLADKGARLRWVLDTHAHADHISSGRALADRFGVPYYLHPYDAIHPMDLLPPRIGYEPLRDGQALTLGGARAEIIHVPGHTLGQINVLLTDPDGEQYLFSGDNLFIQSFGRPDLGGRGKDWAPYVYDSIFGTIKQRVMNSALVLPGHYAGYDEADAAGVYRKRLMALWRQNRALQITERDRFVAETLSRLPEFPAQYVEIKRVNTGLSTPDEDAAQELELGKNICGLTGT